MYDPTIFDNLKVAFENHLYDLDNLDGRIAITNRADRMDFAIMARELVIQFTLAHQKQVKAEVILKTSLHDLAGEILEIPGRKPGCSLSLRFFKQVQNVPTECGEIERVLKAIWEDEIQLTQTLSFLYEQEDSKYLNTIEMVFIQKINEENMRDLEDFLEHVLETLEVLGGPIE